MIHIDLTTNAQSSNLNNNASSSGSLNDKKRKRIRYKHMTENEAKRFVEETTEPDDAPCMICNDNKADHQLIHLTQKSGLQKENLCQKRLCFSCIQKCVATQSGNGRDFIIPHCPFCRQPVEKVVDVNTLQVSDLPSFMVPKLTCLQVLVNAMKAKLCFVLCAKKNGVGSFVGEVSTWNVLLSTDDDSQYSSKFTDWEQIWRMQIDFQGKCGWPTNYELIRCIKEKLTKENLLDRSWLPPIYGGTLKTPPRLWTHSPDEIKDTKKVCIKKKLFI